MNTTEAESRPGVCYCCMRDGKYNKNHLLWRNDPDNDEFWDMLSSCFSFREEFQLWRLKGDDCFICSICIRSLKEAKDFKTRIEETQKTLLYPEIPTTNVVYMKQCSDNEESIPDDSECNLEYLEEYEDIVRKPLRKLKQFTGAKEKVNRSIIEKELEGKQYTAVRWRQFLQSRICVVAKQCLVCMETFRSLRAIKIHQNVHYPVFTCRQCGKSFADRPRVQKHATVHMVGTFPCSHCEKVFDTKSKLVCHADSHNDLLRHHCRFCPERFATYQQKTRHEVAAHDQPEKPFKCKDCDMMFATTVRLTLHVRKVHLKERCKYCTICGKAFFNMERLNNHMIVHNGQRLLKSQQNTRRYPETGHTNEKRFVCQICERSYAQKYTLKVHMKTHNEDSRSFVEFVKKDEKSGKVCVYLDFKK